MNEPTPLPRFCRRWHRTAENQYIYEAEDIPFEQGTLIERVDGLVNRPEFRPLQQLFREVLDELHVLEGLRE